MDNYHTNLAYRQQVKDNLRVGFEVQYGSPKYCFVGGMPFEKGYVWILNIPLSFKINEQERIRLDGFVRSGFRFQGILIRTIMEGKIVFLIEELCFLKRDYLSMLS